MPITPPTCPAGSERQDSSALLGWVTEDDIADALGDWKWLLARIPTRFLYISQWLPTVCATVPSGPFDFDGIDWETFFTEDGAEQVWNAAMVVQNRIRWTVWNRYCQCVAVPTCAAWKTTSDPIASGGVHGDSYTKGIRFECMTARTVESIGLWFGSAQPRNSSYPVGLWSDAGTLLASGTAAVSGSSHAYFGAAISPVTLSVGSFYRIGYHVANGGVDAYNAGANYSDVTRNGIKVKGAYYHQGAGSLTFPNTVGAFWYAADALFCVPGDPTPIDDLPALPLPTGFEAAPGVPACSTDQLCLDVYALRTDMESVKETLKVIQRQAAPFGYSQASTQSISGAGSLTVSGILAASVDFTTIPNYKARKGSGLVDYLDLGWLGYGTSDGVVHRVVLRHDPQMIEPIPGWATILRWDLAPGVVATLKTYRRLM